MRLKLLAAIAIVSIVLSASATAHDIFDATFRSAYSGHQLALARTGGVTEAGVPEPASVLLLGAGLLGLAGYLRKAR